MDISGFSIAGIACTPTVGQESRDRYGDTASQ